MGSDFQNKRRLHRSYYSCNKRKEVNVMQNKSSGHQCIKCNVETCAYNDCADCTCTLSSIDVKPCCGCHNGKAEDETNCSSYKAK